MQLKYDSLAAKEAFIDWYSNGHNKDIYGKDLAPEENPDIFAIVEYFNNEVAFGPAVEVVDG